MTQFDVKLVLAAEEYIKTKLEPTEIDEKEAMVDINHLSKVM